MDAVWLIEWSVYGLVVLAVVGQLLWVFVRRDLHRRTKRPPRAALPLSSPRLPSLWAFLGWRLLVAPLLVLPQALAAGYAWSLSQPRAVALVGGLTLASILTLGWLARRSYQICCAWHHLGAALEVAPPKAAQSYARNFYTLRGILQGVELKVWSEPGDTQQSALQVWGVVRVRTHVSWPGDLQLRLRAREPGLEQPESDDPTEDAAFSSCFVAEGRDARALLTPELRAALLKLECHAEFESLQAGWLRTWLPGLGKDPARCYGAVSAQLEAHRLLAAAAAAEQRRRVSQR